MCGELYLCLHCILRPLDLDGQFGLMVRGGGEGGGLGVCVCVCVCVCLQNLQLFSKFLQTGLSDTSKMLLARRILRNFSCIPDCRSNLYLPHAFLYDHACFTMTCASGYIAVIQ